MGALKDVFAHHFEVVALLAGLFVVGVVITPPPQGSLRPPSVCIAPFLYYARIGKLQLYLLFCILLSGLITSNLKRRTAGDDAPPPTRTMRAYGVLALLLSFASIVLIAVLATYIAQVIFRSTALIRSWSLLTQTETREYLVTGSFRWEMVARDIFNRFGWRSYNRIGI
ncbi:hypothetical protein TRIUR3_23625 [Triticum urartu]|uniref:Uncharacterized protein n=1 Tax=Triticum urartu TaxID=4572 RepID=M8AQL6_TRIUA|nr:hypothetical protein TRIUR3_23625 [Triticum urartu]